MGTKLQHDINQIREFTKIIQKKTILWLTEQTIQLIDPIQRVPLQILVSGILQVKIDDFDEFLLYMQRGKQEITIDYMESQIKNVIFMRIRTYVAQSIQKNRIGAMELEQYAAACSKEVEEKYKELFHDCGMELVEFSIVEIMPTEESKERVRIKSEETTREEKESVIRIEEQRYCDQCGAKWSNDAMHCHSCNHPILVTPSCKRCGYVFLREGKYCPECGKKREDSNKSSI